MALTLVENKAGIRRFDDATLQGSIQRALDALDQRNKQAGREPAKIAAVAHGEVVNGQGQADLSLVFRNSPESDWTVCAAAFKKFGGDMGAGVQVVWSK